MRYCRSLERSGRRRQQGEVSRSAVALWRGSVSHPVMLSNAKTRTALCHSLKKTSSCLEMTWLPFRQKKHSPHLNKTLPSSSMRITLGCRRWFRNQSRNGTLRLHTRYLSPFAKKRPLLASWTPAAPLEASIAQSCQGFCMK